MSLDMRTPGAISTTLGGRQPAAEDFRIAVAPIAGQMVGVLIEHLASLCVNTSRIGTEPLQWIENADTRMSALQLCDDLAILRLPGVDHRTRQDAPTRVLPPVTVAWQEGEFREVDQYHDPFVSLFQVGDGPVES